MAHFGESRAPKFQSDRPGFYRDLDLIYEELKDSYRGTISEGKLGYDDRSKMFFYKWAKDWNDHVWYGMPCVTLYNQHRMSANIRSMILADSDAPVCGYNFMPAVRPIPGMPGKYETRPYDPEEYKRNVASGKMPRWSSFKSEYYEDLNEMYEQIKSRLAEQISYGYIGFDDRNKMFYLAWTTSWSQYWWQNLQWLLTYNQQRLVSLERELLLGENVDKPLAWGLDLNAYSRSQNPEPQIPKGDPEVSGQLKDIQEELSRVKDQLADTRQQLYKIGEKLDEMDKRDKNSPVGADKIVDAIDRLGIEIGKTIQISGYLEDIANEIRTNRDVAAPLMYTMEKFFGDPVVQVENVQPDGVLKVLSSGKGGGGPDS